MGVKLAESRLNWIKSQGQPAIHLADGQRVGKAHRLKFSPQPGITKTSSRVGQTEIVITYSDNISPASPQVQAAAKRAGIRALRSEAERLLPQRLAALAAKHDFRYNQLSIKQMKSRWGSCDQHQNIVLNLFLMQLSWQQIDYVLLHELTHTKVLRHGPDFWQAMEQVLPGARQLSREIRGAKPLLGGSAQSVS